MTNIGLVARNFYVDNNKIWYVEFQFNVLCCFDMDEKKICLIKYLPNDYNNKDVSANILKYEDRLILIPHFSTDIFFYDINKQEFEKIVIPDMNYNFQTWRGAFIKNDLLWIFPDAFFDKIKIPQLCYLSLKTKEIYLINIECLELSDYVFPTLAFSETIEVVGDKAYFVLCNSDKLFELDLLLKDIQVHNLGKKIQLNTIVALDDENFCLSMQNGNIIEYNIRNHNLVEYFSHDVKKRDDVDFSANIYYRQCFKYMDKIMLIPSAGEKISIFNCKNKKITVFDKIRSNNHKDNDKWMFEKYSAFYDNKDMIYIWSLVEKCIYIFSIKNEETHVLPLSTNDNLWDKEILSSLYGKKNEVFIESNDVYGMRAFLEYISNIE